MQGQAISTSCSPPSLQCTVKTNKDSNHLEGRYKEQQMQPMDKGTYWALAQMHHRQLTGHNGLDQQYFIECHIDGSPNCRRQVRDQGTRKIMKPGTGECSWLQHQLCKQPVKQIRLHLHPAGKPQPSSVRSIEETYQTLHWYQFFLHTSIGDCVIRWLNCAYTGT